MSTSTTIAISCFTVLIILNLLLPSIQQEIEGHTIENTAIDVDSALQNLNTTSPESSSGIFSFLGGLWSFLMVLVKIFFWNWDFNIYINLILSLLKIALAVSLLEILAP